MALKWTKTALDNLGKIADYIAKDNLERAKTFIQEIREETNLLVEFHSVGRAGRVVGTRELVAHKNYIVVYRLKGVDVQIIRIHHVAQKYPDRFE